MTLMTIVTDGQEIQECFDTLLAALRKNGNFIGRKSLDFHGAKRVADIHEQRLTGQHGHLNLAGIKNRSKYFILTGISSERGRIANMDFQLAIPFSGIDRSCSCAFAKDNAGYVYLVHRGIFFGGKYTMRRTFFFEHYEGLVAYVEDGPERNKVAILGDLENKKLVDWFSYFLNEMERISAIAHGVSSRNGRHKLDRTLRIRHRALVKAAIIELNSNLSHLRELKRHKFVLYQPRNSDVALASLEFNFNDETFVLETTLERERIKIDIYPRAKMRGRRALEAFIKKGFEREINIISKGEVGYEYDGSRISYEISLRGNRGREKALFVEYTNIPVGAIAKVLAKD